MDYKRLKEIQTSSNPTLHNVVELVAENFLSASLHSKEIKNMLTDLLDKVSDLSNRLIALESKQSNIFQIEINEEMVNEEDELSIEDELALDDGDD